MSNLDFEPDDVGPPVDFVSRRAQALVATGVDAEPDKAARANQIADAVGADPGAVFENLDQFEAQHKNVLSAAIVGGNPRLQAYVNDHPLAAKISNDDLGQLDTVSSVLDKQLSSIAEAGWKGFVENFHGEEMVSEHERLAKMLASQPVIAGLAMQTGLLPLGAGLDLATRLFGGVIGGAAGAIGETYKQLGGDETQGAKLTRDLIVAAQVGMSGQAGLHGFVASEVHAMFHEAARAAKTIAPYVDAGKEPPVGIHPEIDALKVEQAKIDADNLSEALKESVKSATRERAPDLFADFVRKHTDGDIGISADAVRALYGDKVPSLDDGILGFVPDLAAQLERAEATGGDLKVSLADYLAKVEPEVHKQIEDHIRSRPDGMTVEEGKEVPAPSEVEPIGPVETVRQSAGLQGIQERKLSLQRGEAKPSRDGAMQHHLILRNQEGNPLAHINLVEEKGGERLFVDDINVDKPYSEEGGANTVGPSAMREALIQIKEMFPNAKTLEGMRVSGGRERANKPNVDAEIDLTKIKPRAKPPEEPKPGLLQRAKEAIVGKTPKQLELDVTRMEDRAVFEKAAAMGRTVDQYKRYQKLIEQRALEDTEAANKRIMAEQRKTQTAEWKANRAELRPKVQADIEARPEVEFDEMLREGRVKLSKEGLTDDQVALLPKDWVAAEGIHYDDLASLFGDVGGRELVDRVITLNQARDTAGMKPKPYLQRLTEIETDRQMEERYGSLDRNILEEAKDQVLSETEEQLLHEEVLARASEAGLEYSIGKDDLKAAIKGFFDRQRVRDVSSDQHLAESGRAWRAMETALLKGDYAEAFRQAQRQFNAVVMATFAKRFEKAQARFEKVAERYDARELKAVDQEYTNWVRDILARVGKLDARKIPDLQGLIEKSDSGIKTLAEFVDYKERHDLREVPVAEFLTDPNFRKGYEELSTAEAQEVHDSVRALDKNGRDEKKYIRLGEAHDLAELKDKLVESLQRFKEKAYDAEGRREQFGAGLRGAVRTAGIAHLQVEAVFNRLDRFDHKGPWNQFVFRPLVEAANHEALLEREFAKKLGAIADGADLKEVIPNEIFKNPFDDSSMRMTRKNLRAVLLNAGNESNLLKLTAGYKIGSESLGGRFVPNRGIVKAWLNEHATKADWEWAQNIWDLLKELGERSDIMYRSLTGVAPEKIKIEPIQTPHGQFDGGYYPLIRHELYGEDIKLVKTDLEGQGYIRATTAAGYTKKRTGAIYPLSLDLDSLPNQIKQIIHDTSFRPAIIEAGKIFYDNKIKNEFKKHLGAEYSDMFVPWLKDVANTQNYFASKATKDFMAFSDFMRQNSITTLVGFNIGTVMKHTPTAIASSMAEVGPRNFLKAVSQLLTVNEETGNNNWQFAMKTSEELQRRARNWVETMGGGQKVLEGGTLRNAMKEGEYLTAAMNLRDIITQVSSKPVAIGDLISAVPTWMAKYTMEMEEHGVLGDAVYAADKSVRQAHGSSAITSKSAIARSRALSWFTGFFTFFNDLFNRQVETLWKAGEAYDLAKEGRYKEAMKLSTEVSGRLFAYVIVPAMVEELVTPLMSDKKESWGMKAAKGLTFTLSSSYVFVREVVNAMLNGRDPAVGLLSTSEKALTDMARDLSAVKPKPGNIIKHGTMLSGMLTGLTPAPIGKAAEFALGNEKPKGPWGWMVGLRYGTLQNHSKTFDEWMKGH